MWAALFLLTLGLMLLPMLPAIIEWRWPSDVVPLHIDGQDALDPPFLARSFVGQLTTAVAKGQPRLGRSLIALAPLLGAWPFAERERRLFRSRRVWHAAGDITLPAKMTFLGEVAAAGSLRTASDAVYRALWAGGRLQLADFSTVLRWAHGHQVDVHSGCLLAGRISAEQRINVLGPASFMLLHAPMVCFGAGPGAHDDADFGRGAAAARPAPSALPASQACGGLPSPVQWNAVARRGTCDDDLQVAAGSHWRGDLVCHADLTLGPRCSTTGSIKAHGDLVAGAACKVAGNLVIEGRIDLGPDCSVLGSVISEQEIVLGAGCVIGAPGALATVAAPRIRIAPDVVVHGTIWAGESGRTESVDAWDDEPERLDAAFVDRHEGVQSDWPETQLVPRPPSVEVAA